MSVRVPLGEEPISDTDAIIQYDKGARCYMVPEYRYFVRKIKKRGIKQGRVLDIGTGTGLLAIELAKAKDCHFNIIALDISPNMIKKARENARQAGVEGKIQFIVGTAASLPFRTFSFDLVISYASLHHWFKPVLVFNEIGRVTREGGDFIVRDNKRLYANPLWGPAVWIVSRFMNRRHRENWPKALMASYTISEAKKLLASSNLKSWRVISDFLLVDLSIESQPKRKAPKGR